MYRDLVRSTICRQPKKVISWKSSFSGGAIMAKDKTKNKAKKPEEKKQPVKPAEYPAHELPIGAGCAYSPEWRSPMED